MMFLKTHKTGSSTLTSIMNRYADLHNLSVVLPPSYDYHFKWPEMFQLNTVESSNPEPRALCNHARFNKVPLNILFPKERSFYLTIIREPVSHFESVFYFFHYDVLMQKNIEDFMNSRMSYGEWKTWQDQLLPFVLSRNPLMFDLGFPLRFYEDHDKIDKYIRLLDQEFDLVLVLEHFDESLVLMKRLLCWSMEDILYFKHMERMQYEKNQEYLTTNIKRKIEEWNQADVRLYKHFNATLWKKIEREGPEFYDDLWEFHRKLGQIKETCLYSRRKKTLAYTGRYVMGYKLKTNIPEDIKSLCEKMLRKEVEYLDYFRNISISVEDENEQGWGGIPTEQQNSDRLLPATANNYT